MILDNCIEFLFVEIFENILCMQEEYLKVNNNERLKSEECYKKIPHKYHRQIEKWSETFCIRASRYIELAYKQGFSEYKVYTNEKNDFINWNKAMKIIVTDREYQILRKSEEKMFRNFDRRFVHLDNSFSLRRWRVAYINYEGECAKIAYKYGYLHSKELFETYYVRSNIQ